MSKDQIEHYQHKIRQLEQEIVEREKDLATFRRELAQVNKQLETLIGQIHRDIKMASEIQKILVPTEFPNIQGIDFSYKFAASTIRGGDYFDIFEHEDKFRFGLIIAAGSGHGMSALLLSVLLNISSKMEARKGADPHKIIKTIFEEMKPHLTDRDRADVFYGLMDRRSFELSYCLLGGVVALHQSGTDGELTLLESHDSLQLNASLPKSSQIKVLSAKDRLIIASPGIVTCKNLDGEEFGSERFFEIILKAPKNGVHELRNEVFIALKKFTSGSEIPRDQSLVVAEIKSRVIKLAK
jgi:sigma-B regulation protein RsbU (phosphoserine phosphatase)